MPTALQDAFTVCAVYLTMTASNKSTVLRIIESKAADLFQRHRDSTTSIADNLAYVQALILVRIVQIFDGDIRQRAFAEQNESVLDEHTKQLESRTEAQLFSSRSQNWSSWIFAESTRRTIIMSYISRALYESLKTGFCTAAAEMAPRMFTPQAAFWDLPLSNSLQNLGSFILPPVSSYYDFVRKSEKEDPTYAEPFERLLLIACKGEDCSEVMYSDPQHIASIMS